MYDIRTFIYNLNYPHVGNISLQLRLNHPQDSCNHLFGPIPTKKNTLETRFAQW